MLHWFRALSGMMASMSMVARTNDKMIVLTAACQLAAGPGLTGLAGWGIGEPGGVGVRGWGVTGEGGGVDAFWADVRARS